MGKQHYPACSSATNSDDGIIHGLLKTPLGIILQPFHMVESLTLFFVDSFVDSLLHDSLQYCKVALTKVRIVQIY